MALIIECYNLWSLRLGPYLCIQPDSYWTSKLNDSFIFNVHHMKNQKHPLRKMHPL